MLLSHLHTPAPGGNVTKYQVLKSGLKQTRSEQNCHLHFHQQPPALFLTWSFQEALSPMDTCATAESSQTWPLTEKRLISVLKIQGFEFHFGSNGNQCRSQADFPSHFQQEMLLNEQSACQTSLQYEYKSTVVRAFPTQLRQLCLKTLFSFCGKSTAQNVLHIKFQIPNSLKLVHRTIHPINSIGYTVLHQYFNLD